MLYPVDKNNSEAREWAIGCKAWLLNDSTASTIKEERMEAGTREQLHLHKKTEQFFYILEGQAILYVESKANELNPQQGMAVPALTTHYIANESDEPVRFLVISAPGMNNAVPDRENISL